MNVFRLSNDPRECAKYHCDKHVSKMLVEGVQVIQTALFLNGYPREKLSYKPTQFNHPIIKWCRESLRNLMYVHGLCHNLHEEWKFRYGHPEDKEHKSFQALKSIDTSKFPMYFGKHFTETQQPKVVPEDIANKYDDVVEAYRAYYRIYKSRFADWKKGREKPHWFHLKNVDIPSKF